MNVSMIPNDFEPFRDAARSLELFAISVYTFLAPATGLRLGSAAFRSHPT
jgi:hypothetical protein